jgi:hypothetical protein
MEAEKWLITPHSAARRLIVMWALILAFSDDKEAFTATFSGLVVSLDATGSAPIVTRVFSFALPLSGADPGMEIPFFVSGFVLSQEGANGHLLFSVNDQSMVVDFPPKLGQRFRPTTQLQSRLCL